MARILVRSTGDVGSAVAHRLFRDGHAVALVDDARPTHTRRGMAFADAVFDGKAELAGVLAKRMPDADGVEAMLACGRAIPVDVDDADRLAAAIAPDVVVDARMRKRARAESQRHLAPLTIGLGPGFVAGDTVDVAIETAWGDALGAVVRRGATRDLAGEPGEVGGHRRERFVYAPVAGCFRTTRAIGDHVEQGDAVARIGAVILRAPLGGRLRGLCHDGVTVAVRTKVIEVDARDDPALVRGLGARPARIAEGVCAVVAEAFPH